MSCPHVAGIAALFKSLYWDWCPAATRSCTRSYWSVNFRPYVTQGVTLQLSNLEQTEWTYTRRAQHGRQQTHLTCRHVNLNKAINPGPVFNITTEDYIQFLCFMGHKNASISRLRKPISTAWKITISDRTLTSHLLPSPNLHKNKRVTATRKVTNAGTIISFQSSRGGTMWHKNDSQSWVLCFNKTNKILSLKIYYCST